MCQPERFSGRCQSHVELVKRDDAPRGLWDDGLVGQATPESKEHELRDLGSVCFDALY